MSNLTFDFQSSLTQPNATTHILYKPELNECFVYFNEPLSKYFYFMILAFILLVIVYFLPKDKNNYKGIIFGFIIYFQFMITLLIYVLMFLE